MVFGGGGGGVGVGDRLASYPHSTISIKRTAGQGWVENSSSSVKIFQLVSALTFVLFQKW